MNDLESQVCRLLFTERLSNREAARRLNLTPAEVVNIAVKSRTKGPSSDTAPLPGRDETEEEQIQRLRLQVRQGLLERTRSGAIDDIPAHALVRLWSLIEDQRLIHADASSNEDPILESLPEDIKTQIIALLEKVEEG